VGYLYWNGSSYVGANYLTVNSYDPPGHVTRSSIGSGMVATSASYNSRLEISSLAYNTTPATVWSKLFTWTPNGNLQQAADTIAGTTREYGYDPLNRITSALDVNTGTQTPASNGLTENFTYDAFGNLWESGNFTFWPVQYTAGNEPYGATYDAAGNLMNDGLGNSFTWDEEGRVSTANGVGYSYNAAGDRVGKSGSGSTDTIYFDGRPVARLSGGAWTDLVYSGSTILAEVPSMQPITPVYRLTDHLGSSVATISSPNPPFNIQDYAPFCQLFNGSSTNDPYKFTGKERDTESGNDYFDARYYASAMGRFMSPDWGAGPVPYATFGNPQTLNLYAYLRNNPLAGVDEDGHCGGPGDPCGDIAVTAQVTQQPTFVRNDPETVDGKPVLATGPAGSITFQVTYKSSGSPIPGVRVSESNDKTVTIGGKQVPPGPTVEGSATSNNKGKWGDVVGRETLTDGTNKQNDAIVSAYSSTTVTVKDQQTMTLTLPNGGGTCSATDTRTLSNVGPGGKPSSTYTITPSNPPVKVTPPVKPPNQ
jgi:RHS repeat-associated protein